MYSSGHIPTDLPLRVKLKTCHGTPNPTQLRGTHAILLVQVIILSV